MSELFNDANSELIIVNFKICLYFFISLILFIFAHYISKGVHTKKKRKEYKDVISPILAEVLIDGKIDIKNLILTTIIELQIKRNLVIVNGNTIELLHKDNLNIHELYLVDMIFQDKKMINFNEINDRFAYNRNYSTIFTDKMSKITEEIQTKLYEMKLFSAKRMLALKVTIYLAMIIFINLPILLMTGSDENFLPTALLTITTSIIATLIYFSSLFSNNVNSASSELLRKELGTNIFDSKTITTIFTTMIALISVFLFAFVVDFNFISLLGMFGIYFINIITFRQNKTNVLSAKGVMEKRKVLELKNFLKDYDLRKKDGQDTYIIWNEYFAYAAALGISNPVISDIFKEWNKLDIILYFTNNLI